MNKAFSLIFILLAFAACQSNVSNGKSDIEKSLEEIGLQNVAEEIPGVEVYMVYSTPYNFMGRVLYEGLDEAYLVPEEISGFRHMQAALYESDLQLRSDM